MLRAYNTVNKSIICIKPRNSHIMGPKRSEEIQGYCRASTSPQLRWPSMQIKYSSAIQSNKQIYIKQSIKFFRTEEVKVITDRSIQLGRNGKKEPVQYY